MKQNACIAKCAVLAAVLFTNLTENLRLALLPRLGLFLNSKQK